MSQSVFCQNCQTKTDVMDQVGRILNSDKNKVELEDLEISCCENPDILWITSKELKNTSQNIAPEEVEDIQNPESE